MTRRLPWAVRGLTLLTVLSISLLTVTSLAQTTNLDDGEKTCSEGCHEARSEPRPDWHPALEDRTANGAELPKISVPVDDGGTAALTPTTLTLSPSSPVTAGEPISLVVALRDVEGAPVPKAEIRFLVDAKFAGTQGQMEVGVARTDADGVASLDFQPTLAQEKQVITARFEGLDVYAESEQSVEITSVGTPPPAYVVAPIGLEVVGRWTLAAFLAAILGVWVAFGFVLYQGYAIWKGS